MPKRSYGAGPPSGARKRRYLPARPSKYATIGAAAAGALAYGYKRFTGSASAPAARTARVTENSKSAGFISSRSKVNRRAKNITCERLGVVETYECGGVLDGGAQSAAAGNTVVLGHCTLPTATASLCLFRAIVKLLFSKLNIGANKWDDGYRGMQNGDIIRLQIFTNEETATPGTVDTTIAAGIQTFEQIAGNMSGNMLAASRNTEYNIRAVEFIPVSTTVLSYQLVDLTSATIHVDSKSTLKFQNRSVNASAGDEESVDNVPLYGKSYEGLGNGTGAINRNNSYSVASRDFIAHDRTGIMSKVPTETYYQEVVPPEMLEKVNRFGKVHLDPGHLKTSTLTSRLSMPVQKFWREVCYQSGTISHHRHYKGKFRFMMLEKMMAATLGTSTNSIKVAFEHNITIGAYVIARRNMLTAPLVSVSNFASEN